MFSPVYSWDMRGVLSLAGDLGVTASNGSPVTVVLQSYGKSGQALRRRR